MGCTDSKPAAHSPKPASPRGQTDKDVQQRNQSGSVKKPATVADDHVPTAESANARKYEEVRRSVVPCASPLFRKATRCCAASATAVEHVPYWWHCTAISCDERVSFWALNYMQHARRSSA